MAIVKVQNCGLRRFAQYQSWVCRGMLKFALAFWSMSCIASILQNPEPLCLLLQASKVWRDFVLRLHFTTEGTR